MAFEQDRSAGWTKIDFDPDGPRVSDVRLLKKSRLGFAPRTTDELAAVFSPDQSLSIDVKRLATALAYIAEAMNKGDLGLAAVATSRLRLPNWTREAERLTARPSDFSKASVDDPKHPGYPAGAPDGKGGQFRPKDPVAGSDAAERAERLKRLAERKTFRSIARRVLSVKRVMRMIVKYVDGMLVEDVPVINDIVGAASLKDDLDLMIDIAQDTAESDAAIDFINKGPLDLEDLQVSSETPQSFSSFDAFKKIEFEKQFGPAGDGYDYHHIVEQGPNADVFPQEQLQSTDNIVRIPRLMHEELNSVYATPQSIGRAFATPREYLRGRSFDEQRTFGLMKLREIGVLN